MDINTVMAFVCVVDSGSFTAAARDLDLPRSTVSARVAALESRLGTRLLRRTTRRIALTDDGRRYYDLVAGAVATLRHADHIGTANASALSGTIRLSIPLDFPTVPLSRAIADFRQTHPLVRFDVRVENERADFLSDNIDLAIRGGEPTGQELVTRRIASFRMATFVRAHADAHHQIATQGDGPHPDGNMPFAASSPPTSRPPNAFTFPENTVLRDAEHASASAANTSGSPPAAPPRQLAFTLSDNTPPRTRRTRVDASREHIDIAPSCRHDKQLCVASSARARWRRTSATASPPL